MHESNHPKGWLQQPGSVCGQKFWVDTQTHPYHDITEKDGLLIVPYVIMEMPLSTHTAKPTCQTQRRSLQGMALHLGRKMMLYSFCSSEMQTVW